MTAWFESLLTHEGKGKTAPRATSLGGLAARREITQGQYFSPPALVDLLWRIVTPAIEDALARGRPGDRVSLFDSSCGVGRMFWPAHPDKHILVGCDIDAQAIEALTTAAAGFSCDLRVAPIEEIRPRCMSVGLINPPFGLHFNSPTLEPYDDDITTWGSYGRCSAAESHPYAIAQALNACDVVVAVVPASFVDIARATPTFASRLVATIELPARTFLSEGTAVRTAVLVFGRDQRSNTARESITIDSLDAPLPQFPLACRVDRQLGRHTIGSLSVTDTEPVITLPVTGDRRVKVAHDRRKVHLRFFCGYTQARVMNAILRDRITRDDRGEQRLPRGIEYHGQGLLDLENYLVQSNPLTAFEGFLRIIEEADAEPIVDSGIRGYLRRRMNRNRLRAVPLLKNVYRASHGNLDTLPIGADLTCKATTRHVIDPESWTTAVVHPGDEIRIRVAENGGGDRRYDISRKGRLLGAFPQEVIEKHYSVSGAVEPGWYEAHAGRLKAFPQLAAARMHEAKRLKLDDVLSWKFQLPDVVEVSLSNRGVLGWEPACGKSRAAFGLVRLCGGTHNLIVVESRLVAEMLDQFQRMGVPAPMYQVIRKPDHARNLRTINIVSYERLRSSVAGRSRRTYGHLMRRRLCVVIADEGGVVLSNPDSDRARALYQLSPKRRYAFDGSPLHSYAQHCVSVLQWAALDGGVTMPYGRYHPFLSPINLKSMAHSRRGADEFRDRHITLAWCTSEFKEDNRKGGKRQVPFIRNIEQYRALLAPHILRRTTKEPDVAPYLNVPVPTKHFHKLAFDRAHLHHYLTISESFAEWYRKAKADADRRGKGLNMITVLARIGAVQRAANDPTHAIGRWNPYTALTSKHRKAIALIEQFTAEGRKTVLFAHNPSTLRLLEQELRARGIDSVMCHGDISIAKRNKAVLRQFKYGRVQNLLASYGVAQRGHNWECCSRALMYERCWTPGPERQAGMRLLRNGQTDDVEFHFLELDGSIDSYMGQHVDMKADAIDSGLDYTDQHYTEGDFKHIDTILGQFVEDLATKFGKTYREMRDELMQAA